MYVALAVRPSRLVVIPDCTSGTLSVSATESSGRLATRRGLEPSWEGTQHRLKCDLERQRA